MSGRGRRAGEIRERRSQEVLRKRVAVENKEARAEDRDALMECRPPVLEPPKSHLRSPTVSPRIIWQWAAVFGEILCKVEKAQMMRLRKVTKKKKNYI